MEFIKTNAPRVDNSYNNVENFLKKVIKEELRKSRHIRIYTRETMKKGYGLC